MSKLIAVLGGALLLGVGIATVQLLGSSEPANATGTATRTTTIRTAGTIGGADISGPCDEAEHAPDPRCMGGVRADDDDRSGRGRDDDDRHEDDDHDEDRRGSNSGRG
jgi:hypothetical protein